MGVRLPRLDLQPLGWAAGAMALSLAAGVLAGVSSDVALDMALVAVAAVAIALRPYFVLIGVVLILAAVPQREWLPFVLFAGAALALAVRAPSLPGKCVWIPLLLLLLIALPSVPLLPTHYEGLVANPYLHLPDVGVQYARTPSIALHDWLSLGSVVALFSLAAWCVRSRIRVETVARAVVLSSVLPIAVGIGQLATGNTYERIGTSLHSVRGTFPHPNYFAFYLVVVLALAIALLLESSSIALRVGLSLLVVAGVVCLFLTYTRSAWIGFAITLLGIAVLRYRRLLVLAFVGLAIAALAAPGAVNRAEKRFGDLTSRSQANDSSSWDWRIDQWSAILPYGFDRPFTGQGWDSYARLTVRKFGHGNRRFPTVRFPAYGVFSPVGFTAHNDYVKSFVELGVPGFVLWVLTLVGLLVTSLRARRLPGVGGIASASAATAIALMVMSASDNLQGYTAVLSYAFVVCGALAGVTAAYARRGPGPVGARAWVGPVEGVATEHPPAEAPAPAAPESAEPARGVAPARARQPARLRDRARSRVRLMLGRRRP